MKFPDTYVVLSTQSHSDGAFELIPIRAEDRYAIMKWRNEQIYHLRQQDRLTSDIQDQYFDTVVRALFDDPQPKQILFSFLENGKLIGYGGLVHINWHDLNAEISFVMDTKLEGANFVKYWQIYLDLVTKVAFDDLSLHKIFIYAFDLRPKLYIAAEEAGFFLDGRLVDHCIAEGAYRDVVIYSKINYNENTDPA